MKMGRFIQLAVIAASLSSAVPASAVEVSGLTGPWDINLLNSAYDYGTHDSVINPAYVSVSGGDNIVITYVSGQTGAFFGFGPEVDGVGYPGGPYGSGPDDGRTGIGTSGTNLPSFYIDPTNNTTINLNALMGAFEDINHQIIGNSIFVVNNGPYSAVAPVGAAFLTLGFNDDIFSDNSGALQVSVSINGVSAVPEASTWAMMLLGFAGIGAITYRRRRSVVLRGA